MPDALPTPTDLRTGLSADTRRTMGRRHVIRAVEDTIDRKADPADADALRRELADLCRDLGVADIARLNAQAARTNPLLEPSPAGGRGQGEGGATNRSPPPS